MRHVERSSWRPPAAFALTFNEWLSGARSFHSSCGKQWPSNAHHAGGWRSVPWLLRRRGLWPWWTSRMMEPQRSLLLPGSKIRGGEEIVGYYHLWRPWHSCSLWVGDLKFFESKFVDPGNSTQLALTKCNKNWRIRNLIHIELYLRVCAGLRPNPG